MNQVLTNHFTNPSFETASGTVDVRTNLATNPSFEAGAGAVTVRTNLAYDPSATATGRWSNIGAATHNRTLDSAVYHEGTTAVRYTLTGSGALGGKCQIVGGVTSGETVSWSIWVYPSVACSFQPYWERTAPTYTGGTAGTLVSCPANTWTKITGTQTFSSAQADPSGVFGFGIYNAGNAFVANDFFVLDEIQVEKASLTNLHPFFTGASAAAGDFTYAWSGTVNDSTSYQQAPGFASPSGQQDSSSIQSTQWSDTGTKSMRSIPRSSASATWPGGSGMAYGMQAGKTYTVSAKLRLATTQTGTLSTYARRISVHKQAGALVAWSVQAPNTAGVHSLSVTFTVPADATAIYPVLYNGSPETDVWWDSLLVEETSILGSYFDGSTPAAGDFTYAWSGPANASASAQRAPGVARIETKWAAADWAGYQSSLQPLSGTKHLRLLAKKAQTFLWGTPAADALAVTPGTPVTISYSVKPSVTQMFRVTVGFDAGSVTAPAFTSCPAGAWTRVWATFTVPAGATLMTTHLNSEDLSTPGATYDFDQMMIEKSGVLSSYFDGNRARDELPDGEWALHAWTGTPGGSTSTRTIQGVHSWTRAWWDRLPYAHRKADPAQNEEYGGYPMRKFMDGPGRVGGELRQVSDDMWAGVYTDPDTVPEGALPWLAQMLGVTESQRDTTPAKLRELLIDLTVTGRASTGTRSGIAEVAKRFLTGARQVSVRPSTAAAHTIVMLVRADEVPGGDLAALVAYVRDAGVVPAGHDLVARAADPSWDTWSAAAGTTWDEKEANAPTWTDSDSLGVALGE